MSKRRHRKIQYAALPYRKSDGGLEVMLITSRETKRWVLPKGWPMKGKKPYEAAAQEAFEEAGLKGQVRRKATGAYRYDKRLKNGAEKPVEVQVFPMRVEKERDEWPEKDERTRQWFAPADAAEAVDEPDLKALLAAFPGEALDADEGSANPEA